MRDNFVYDDSSLADLVYNDAMRPGGRRPRLWVVKDGVINMFQGSSLPGAKVLWREPVRNGKWSGTHHGLRLDGGAKACLLLAPLHGQVWRQASRQAEHRRFQETFKVDVTFSEFDAALARDFPKSREIMLSFE